MTAHEYCKKYVLPHHRLKSLLQKPELKSDYVLSEDELLIYPNSLKKKIKAKGRGKKRKIGKPNPFNPDALKRSVWIVRNL